MLKNYFLMAVRQMIKNKSYLAINILGLGVAMACCITAYILFAYNIEFDSHLDKRKMSDVYRVHTEFQAGEWGTGVNVSSPLAMGPVVQESSSGVSSYLRIMNEGGYLRYKDKSLSQGILLADTSLLSFFDFDLIHGSLESFFSPEYVLITKETALKIFDQENPVGESFIMYFGNQVKKQFVVGAVIQKYPINSSLNFGMIAHWSHMLDIYQLTANEWGDWHDPTLLLKLTDERQKEEVEKILVPFVSLRNEKKEDAKVIRFFLEPFLTPISEDNVGWSQLNTRIGVAPILIFMSMATIILLISCFNLTNTSLALAARRTKEVGIRKVNGATRSQLIYQFLLEMVLTILIAVILGLFISHFLVIAFTDMWNLAYGLKDIHGLNLVIMLLVLVFITAVASGLYPALLSSSINPVLLMKGNIKIAGTQVVSRILVGIQFALSTWVLICGVVFTRNTHFQEKINFGFNINDIFMVFIQSENEYEILKRRAIELPEVQNVAISHHQLGWSSYPFPIKIDTTEYQVQHIETGENFCEIMGLKLIEGRFPDLNLPSDEFGTIVVNQTFVEKTKLKDPLSASVEVRGQKRRIIGIVSNHTDNVFRSREPEPFVFYASKRNEYQFMLLQASPENLAALRDKMEKIWKEEFPEKPFESRFQEEMMLGNLRRVNQNLRQIFVFLTILGGLLSLAGIFALSAIHVEKHTKEVGVRKVLGGSLLHIVVILSRPFFWILGISALVGGVGGYYLTTLLLDEIYAIHMQVSLFTVLFSVVFLTISGLVTTGGSIFKAAMANPVKTLRSE